MHLTAAARSAIDLGDDVSVLSTGQVPSKQRDLLVLGHTTREEFFDDFSRRTADPNLGQKISDDALLLIDGAGTTGVAYDTQSNFLRKAHALCAGTLVDPVVKNWSIGPWLPETFASDLSRALVLRAATPLVVEAIEMFATYPERLRAAVILRCSDEIVTKTALIASASAVRSLARHQLEADVCLAGIRLAYARGRTFFRGLKYHERTKGHLPKELRSVVDALSEGVENYRSALSLLTEER